MPRHMSAEAFQMDLRTSTSQQQLNPSRSSSLESGTQDELDGAGIEPIATSASPSGAYGRSSRSHKVDLYSIPVFCLELIVLAGLAFAAYYVHFLYQHEPLISGFYCDDVAYRQQPLDTFVVTQFSKLDNELTVVVLMIAIPIVIIVFCELVNSMFGALKFRQISALCACCKLHSITRRTFRFSGAYLLGFLIVMISCDILANTTGHLKPYFAQDCHRAYQTCSMLAQTSPQARNPASTAPSFLLDETVPSDQPATTARSVDRLPEPPSAPISALSNGAVNVLDLARRNSTEPQLIPQPAALVGRATFSGGLLSSPSQQQHAFQHQWIDLSGQSLYDVCEFDRVNNDEVTKYRFRQLAMSWPSFPASILTYAGLYIAFYLSFIGTARPFRIITCVLVMSILLSTTVFNASLVRDHFSHWEDVAAGAVLALVVVIFILLVYLNKFRDSHYYENQKLFNKRKLMNESLKGHNIDSVIGPFHAVDKPDNQTNTINMQNGDTGGSISNNDLAMRYFQIPRANYRGAPRPVSAMNQMR